jgi:hypothetical protein
MPDWTDHLIFLGGLTGSVSALVFSLRLVIIIPLPEYNILMSKNVHFDAKEIFIARVHTDEELFLD